MMRKIFVFISLLIVSFISGQNKDAFFKIEYPQFIPANTQFEVSILTRSNFEKLKKAEYFFSSEAQIKIDSVFALNKNGSVRLRLESRLNQNDELISKTSIKDSNFLSSHFYQLKLFITPNTDEISKIDFLINLFDQNDEKHTFNSLDYRIDESISPAIISFYKVQSTSGQSLKISRGSSFKFSSLTGKISDNPVLEFWIKFNNFEGNFFQYRKLGYPSVNFRLNKFGIMQIDSDNQTSFASGVHKEIFLSRNAWYHFVNIVDVKKGNSDLFVNGQLVSQMDFPITENWDDLLFIFENEKSKGSFEIDLLKLWDSADSFQFFRKERHFRVSNSDSSDCKVNFNFDNQNNFRKYLQKNDQIEVVSNKTEFTVSDAPIFSRAPKLTGKLSGQIVMIEWQPADVSDASEFNLERSLEGNEYEVIHSVFASDDPDQIYYYSDRKSDENEIIYYRVKQLNKDGSEAYSSSVKIGIGQKEVFTIGQNYPNPFNPKTTINLEVLEQDEFEITVYDIVGNKVEVLFEGPLSGGLHTFEFDGSDLTSGIYLYEVKTPNFSQVEKMILAK